MIVLQAVNRVTKAVTILFLSVVTVMVAIEVVLRYGFGTSLYVTDELSRYLMVWVVFLGCSLALRDKAHISIEIIANRLTGRARAGYNLVAQLLLLSFLGFLIVEGVIALPFQMDQIIPTLNVAIFWFYLAIPVGGTLMVLNLLPGIAENLRILAGRAKPEPPPPAAARSGQRFL